MPHFSLLPLYLAAFALVLGVLVFVHEFGHYAMAKLFGVRVEVFSLGFGKRLAGFRKGDTDYRLSLLPIGGYVKMSGENPMESRTGDPGEFMSHPRWQRFLIALAGPSMNILLAIAVSTGVFMYRYEYPAYKDQPAVLGWVFDNSSAQKSGLQAGDKIVRIDDIDNPTWQQVIYKVMLSPNQPLDIQVQRNNQLLSKSVVPQAVGRDKMGDMGWLPQGPAIVRVVQPNTPAERAGLQVGDEVLAVNETSVRTGSAGGLNEALQKLNGQSAKLTVLRHGQETALTITPFFDEHEKRFRVGVEIPPEFKIDKLPFGAALNAAVEECKTNSGLIFELVGKMFERKISVAQLDGPIGIARASGDAAREGPIMLLRIMSLISLNLAVFNLFPIPILDGGLMLMLLIEGVMRRDIKQEVKERVYQAAFVFLVLFAAVVIYNDVAKTFPWGHIFQ